MKVGANVVANLVVISNSKATLVVNSTGAVMADDAPITINSLTPLNVSFPVGAITVTIGPYPQWSASNGLSGTLQPVL